MHKAYICGLFTICITAMLTQKASCSDRRLKNRITNAEIKLDTLNNDIAAFRLDMLDIWDKVDELNNSMCSKTTPVSLTTTEQATQQKQSAQETDMMQKIFGGFQSEKKYLHDNIDALKQGEKDMANLMDKQSENIDEVIEDITVFKNEQEKAIGHTVNDIQDLDNKFTNSITAVENGLEDVLSKTSGLEENLENMRKELYSLNQKVQGIEKSYNQNLQTIVTQVNSIQTATNTLKERMACPRSWHVYKESCYYLGTSTVTWTEAKNDCERKGAYLVEHNNEEEAKYLAKLASSHRMWTDVLDVTNTYYWTGASDISTEGAWIWSGSGTRVNFSYWTSNNPDNYLTEDCMTSYISIQGQWNDLDCKRKIKYMCEIAKL